MSPRFSSFISLLTVAMVALQTSPAVVVDGYRILMLTQAVKSHVFPMLSIADGLADRGHEVTVFVHRSLGLNDPRLKVGQRHAVQLERYDDGLDTEEAIENFTMMAIEGSMSLLQTLASVSEMIDQMCRGTLVVNEPLLKKFERQHYDLVVIDGNFVIKCTYLIPHRLGVPYVTYTDGMDPFLIRVPWLPSFVPNMLASSYTDRMSFVERLLNMAATAATSLFNIVPDVPVDVLDNYRRLYGQFRSLDELVSRSSLWLIPRDHINDYARPGMPNVINVGGLTVKRSSEELPKTLKEFIEGAGNGSVVVSFGSMISRLPSSVFENFFSAFRQLDADGYRFVVRLTKTTAGRDADVPKNVLAADWIPQADLLAHPAVKLFVTHCGNSGRYEALYHGVPMIGFPVFAEQPYNARVMEHKGYGFAMDFKTFTPDELVHNIRRVMSDRSFRDRVQKASAIFRSDPQSPAEKAPYWIEHVCRFGGDHLRSAGQDLPLYAYLMLDILAFMLLVVGLAVGCVGKLTCIVKNRCLSKRLDKSKTKLKSK